LIGGNIRQFRARLLDFLLETAREYGPLTSFRIGPRRLFLASGPEAVINIKPQIILEPANGIPATLCRR
jgi:hypothetical protein